MAWYVSKIETNCERKAEKLAPNFGIEAFLPFIEQKFSSGERVMTRPALMFPGYLFVNFASLDVWKRARREGFVFLGLLGSGETYVETVADAVVDELKSRHVNGVVPLREPPKQEFKPGQPIIVERGRYANIRGLIKGTSADRIEVLLSMFNRQFTVPLSANAVRAA